MENIIVGIDFSSCSKNALEHALSVARTLKAKLTLLYVMSPDTRVADGDDSGSLEKKVTDKLEAWANEYRSSYADIKCKVRVASGKIFKEINDDIDYITYRFLYAVGILAGVGQSPTVVEPQGDE